MLRPMLPRILRSRLPGLLAVVALLGACASAPPNYYYTLLPAVGKGGAASEPASSGFALSIQSVQVPEQVDRLQIVVTDPASTQVYPLETSLWAGSLPDEIRQALAAALQDSLSVRDMPITQIPEDFPVWKVALRVQRFDSIYQERAVVDANWTLSPVNLKGRPTLLCGERFSEQVGEGMSSLVAGHQRILQAVAARMASQILQAHAVSGGKAPAIPGCTPSPSLNKG